MFATREQLIDAGATIIMDAYEGGSCGLASWAVTYGTYKWASTNGDSKLGERMTSASVTLYELDKCEPQDEEGEEGTGFWSWGQWFKFGKPLPIDAEMVADFIVAVATGKHDLSKAPEYGRLSDSTLKALILAYYNIGDPFAEWDCMNADQVIQTILLGEVVYG